MPAEAQSGESTEPPKPPSAPRKPFQTAWPWVLCVVGLDYLSTLAYQPSMAFDVAGRLAPLATGLVVLVTLLFALPVYWYIAGRSPDGGGTTGLLERAIPGWFGKLLILILLAFGAVDLVLTRTFSAANASEHITHNPHPDWQHGLDTSAAEGENLRRELPPEVQDKTEGLWNRHTVVTLIVLSISTLAGLVFFRGYSKNFVRLAVVVVAAYLVLTLVVVGTAGAYLIQNPHLFDQWWADVWAGNWKPGTEPKPPGDWGDLILASVPLFPLLALGLSGFELTLMTMPHIRGRKTDDPANPRGRIQRTRWLLVTAALLMSTYLLGSTLVTTVLISPTALSSHGQAKNRAISYLAHGETLADGQSSAGLNPLFGTVFGTVYDVAAVVILALAGLSVAMTLSQWIPPYLHRLGMEFNWSVRLGLMAYLFIAVKFAVVVYYGADLEAQRAAYLTAVLAVFAFAAVIAAVDVWQRRKQRSWHRLLRMPVVFLLAGLVFAVSGLSIAIDRPAALVMTGAFIVVVLGVSIVTRVWRSTELRFGGFTFADADSKTEWEKLCASDFPILVPIRGNGHTLAEKELQIRTLHRVPATMPIMFLQAMVTDASDFSQSPVMRVTRENGRVLIHIAGCVAIPHALAAAALQISAAGAVPEVHFGWSNENPITANLHFVLFGIGNVPWMVHNLIRRSDVPDARKPRVVVG